MRWKIAAMAALVAASPLATSPAIAASDPERIQITGEVIDTWCYFSGVMGAGEAVTGSSHHTCALWCAAGGIPVGVLTEDGTVYMVLKWEGSDSVAKGDTLMEVQSDKITADGLLYERDGINYLVVEQVVANEGITNLTHEIYDVIPGFAIPDPNK